LSVGDDILVANGGDDSVSAINTTSNTVGQTFNVNPLPNRPIGAAPNGLGLIDDSHVAVTLGRDNALAVYTYKGARTPVSFEGFVPTAWYPVGVQFDKALGKLVVTNDKGVGSLGADQSVSQGAHTAPAPQTVVGRNVYSDIGSLSARRNIHPVASPARSRSTACLASSRRPAAARSLAATVAASSWMG